MTLQFDPQLSTAVEVPVANSQNPPAKGPLSQSELDLMQRYWQAANYLTVGQIYLQHNALLREPLTAAHIKPRLLGHWGTSPGLNLLYLHLNRLIRKHDINCIYLAGPGHGGPAVLANVYLEGTYSEIYPSICADATGMLRLFRQFSTPGGVPSHVSAPTPGSIHEGGELGYVLAHAFGAAFDNPGLIVAAVVGDGEAETGPLSGSWKGTRFLNPARDGAVLPILHLNGYKISGPTVLGRGSDEEVRNLLCANGYAPIFVETADPQSAHQLVAAALEDAYATIREIQQQARTDINGRWPAWPAIVLRSPKGWLGPAVVDALPVEGTFRSHQVPLAEVRTRPDHLAMLESWLRSYEPERQFDRNGALVAELAALAPVGDRRMGSNPHANGGMLTKDLVIPALSTAAVLVDRPGVTFVENTRPFGGLLAGVFRANASARNVRLFCPDETNSNRLGDVFSCENRMSMEPIINIDDHISRTGRVMEVLSEHLCEGWLEGYTLTGRHGVYASYEAFAMISASMTVQHAKWLQHARDLTWRKPVPSLNILLTSTCWRNDHNGFSHQGPGLIDVMLSKRGTVTRIYLPPDANSLLAVADHCLRSRDYVNLMVIDKQPHLQYLDLGAAEEHRARGISIWDWAGNAGTDEPDVVLASAGDVPTLELLAATHWLRSHVPTLKVRVVNVLDLMALFPADVHPHGISDERFGALFTEEKPVIFAFHGYQRAIHEIIHGRVNPARFHVRGFNEQGSTTTPFQMVALNGMSRYQLATEALRRSRPLQVGTDALLAALETSLRDAANYAATHFEDEPGITSWTWS